MMKNKSLLEKNTGEIINYLRPVKRYLFSICFKDAILLQTPLHGNLGDHAIAKAEAEMFDRTGIAFCDFPWTEGLEARYARVTSTRKPIFITGGGFLGSLWKNEETRFRQTLQAFQKNRVIVFPQTIYFDMDTEDGRKYFEESRVLYESHPNLTIFVRERYSLEFMKKYMPGVHVGLVPDAAMLLSEVPVSESRKGAVICLRKDKEKTLSDIDCVTILQEVKKRFSEVLVTDTVLSGAVPLDQRNCALQDKLAEFSSARIVITDRLHGMIFAAITETPCIVVNSLSHKIAGCYEWLQGCSYIRFADDADSVLKLLGEMADLDAGMDDNHEGNLPFYDRSKIDKAMQPLYDVLDTVVRK